MLPGSCPAFMYHHTLVLFLRTEGWRSKGQLKGKQLLSCYSQRHQTVSIYRIYSSCCCIDTFMILPLHPSMTSSWNTHWKRWWRRHGSTSFGLVNKLHISWITTKLGLNTLLYSWAKRRLRRVIVHLELTDLLHGVLIACKTNHLMKQASRGSLGCQHIAPVMQQPAANRSSVSLQEALWLPAAQAGFVTYVFIEQHLLCEVRRHLAPVTSPPRRTGSWTGCR